jgi:hypothetical protein
MYVDYSEYLGPDWRKDYKPVKQISTIASTHFHYLDPLTYMATSVYPSFTPASFLKGIPIARTFFIALQCFFIFRDGSADVR